MDTYRFERDFFYDPGMHGVNWDAMKERYMTPAGRRGHAVGRELDHRRVPRRAERVAHLPRRRRSRERRRRARSGCSASTGSWPTARTAIKRIVRGGPWDTGVRLAARRARRRTSRKATTSSPSTAVPLDTKAGSVGRASRTLGQEDRRAHGQRLAVGRPTRGRWSSRAWTTRSSCRFRAWVEERRQIVRQGDRRQGRLHLRAEHRHRRAERADAAVHGAVEERRASSSTSAWNSGGQIPDRFIELLNRPIRRLLGGARRAGAAVAAGRASRPAGDADQRLERIGRRRVSVLLPRGRARSADRHPHVGRAHRHQRRAVARRRRRHHRADLPHADPKGDVVRRRARRRSRHSRSRTIRRSSRRGPIRSCSGPSRRSTSGSPRRRNRRRSWRMACLKRPEQYV